MYLILYFSFSVASFNVVNDRRNRLMKSSGQDSEVKKTDEGTGSSVQISQARAE